MGIPPVPWAACSNTWAMWCLGNGFGIGFCKKPRSTRISASALISISWWRWEMSMKADSWKCCWPPGRAEGSFILLPVIFLFLSLIMSVPQIYVWLAYSIELNWVQLIWKPPLQLDAHFKWINCLLLSLRQCYAHTDLLQLDKVLE